MRIEELHQICKTYNIKTGKKKAEYATNISQCSQTVHQHVHEVDALQLAIEGSNSLMDPAPMHDFY